MKVIVGDLLSIKVGVIGHQTNCIGAVGGLAGSIARQYPDWKDAYVKVCKSLPISQLLGELFLYYTSSDLTIASLFGQRVPGSGVMTDTKALTSALIKLHKDIPPTTPIYLPYGIGCGLGGGDWGEVSTLIEKHCPRAILVRLL